MAKKRIKSTQITHIPPIPIHPVSFLPDDITGVRVTDGSIVQDNGQIDILATSQDTSSDPPTGAGGLSSLQAPQWMVIVSQIAHSGPGGTTLIDAVIDVEDIPGANDYEMRVTIA